VEEWRKWWNGGMVEWWKGGREEMRSRGREVGKLLNDGLAEEWKTEADGTGTIRG